MELAKQVLKGMFEEGADVDNVLEVLQDLDLLNEKGKQVRKEIWGISWKGSKDSDTLLDRRIREFNSFDDRTKKYLIAEYRRGNIVGYGKYVIKHLLENNLINDN